MCYYDLNEQTEKKKSIIYKDQKITEICECLQLPMATTHNIDFVKVNKCHKLWYVSPITGPSTEIQCVLLSEKCSMLQRSRARSQWLKPQGSFLCQTNHYTWRPHLTKRWVCLVTQLVWIRWNIWLMRKGNIGRILICYSKSYSSYNEYI